MLDIYDYDFDSLILKFQEIGFSKLDAKRVYPWLYKKSCSNFDSMSDLSIATRARLKEAFFFSELKCVRIQESEDGTLKALLALSDGQKIENVIIKDKERVTLCLSTQIGCMMGCKFCNTGTQSFSRNLTAGELMAQVLFWKKYLDSKSEAITNIVVMGMGEPFMNFSNISVWLSNMLNKNGMNFSRHRITVSTSGITDYIEEFGRRFKVQLAISLHAPNDEIRNKIMPINKKYNLKCLLDAVRNYPEISNTDYVTFEYLLLKNVNDSLANAKELSRILANIKCKVNLIMFNEWSGCNFLRSDYNQALLFQNEVKRHGITCTIRKSKGNDILAACGQLKSKYEHKGSKF